MIYFASDPHYGHKNIVAGLSSWSDQSGCRKFPSIKAMNDHIIETFNDTVIDTDTLYLLGDIAMGGIQNIIEFRERLNCKNVIVITGNHDHHFAKPEIRALFTEVLPFKELIIEGTRVVLCHYPLHVWNESHKGSIMLHGHCHGTLSEMDCKGNLIHTELPESEKAKRMDVGIDALYMRSLSYAPYSWERIKKIMSQRANLVADHHDSTTT